MFQHMDRKIGGMRTREKNYKREREIALLITAQKQEALQDFLSTGSQKLLIENTSKIFEHRHPLSLRF